MAACHCSEAGAADANGVFGPVWCGFLHGPFGFRFILRISQGLMGNEERSLQQIHSTGLYDIGTGVPIGPDGMIGKSVSSQMAN